MATKMLRSRGETVFQISNYIILSVLSILFVLPFVFVLASSLIGEQELMTRGSFILIPRKLDFGAYAYFLRSGSIVLNAYLVTIFRIVVGTAVNLAVTAGLSYGLAKKKLPGVNIVTGLIFFTMLFGGGLIPTYLVVKGTGLINSLWALVIPSAVSTWNMFIMRNFFREIPASIEESAEIDGASPLRILVSIIVPLSAPAFATIGLFYAVAHWNAWFDAAIYINDVTKLPVQNILRGVVIAGTELDIAADYDIDRIPPPETMKYALIIISTVPILLIYPFIQRYFVKGIKIGAVKG
jgi:putative aldouronate transport system permease protein